MLLADPPTEQALSSRADRRRSLIHPVGVGFIAFIAYVLTSAPGLYYTDSGELAGAAATWGVAHAWTLLPWPSAILGLNILSAIIVAGAVGLFAVLVHEVVDASTDLGKWLIADTSALLLAFSSTLWAQATSIEVYGLHALLFIATLIFTHKSCVDADQPRHTVLAGLLFGLMLSNHLSSVFLIPGLLHIWWRRPAAQGERGRSLHMLRLRQLPWLLVPALVGPTLYALLPLRSASLPPINWGWVHRGWDKFLYHVKGTQFGVWMFSDGSAVELNFSTFVHLATEQLLWIGWIVLVIGVVRRLREPKRPYTRTFIVGLCIVAAGNLAVSLGYSIHDIEPYFLPTLIVLAVMLSWGLGAVTRRVQQWRPALLALPIIPLVLNFGANDLSRHRAVEDYTRWTLDNAEKNAIIITRQWDYLCSAFWYMQTVEGFRTDVVMIDKELLRRTWYAPYLQHLYPQALKGATPAMNAYAPWLEMFEADADDFMKSRANIDEIQRRFVDMLNAIIDTDRPVYITQEILGEESGFAVGYRAVPVGPLLRLVRGEVSQNASLEKVKNLQASLSGRTTRLDSGLRDVAINALANTARRYAQIEGDTAKAVALMNMAMELDPNSRTVRSLQEQLR
jgi:hypothetical protein